MLNVGCFVEYEDEGKKTYNRTKSAISKVDETYCVLGIIYGKSRTPQRQFLNTWCMCVVYLEMITCL
jgi:hypothetical protein